MPTTSGSNMRRTAANWRDCAVLAAKRGDQAEADLCMARAAACANTAAEWDAEDAEAERAHEAHLAWLAGRAGKGANHANG